MKYGKLIVEKKELLLLQQIISRIPKRIDESYRVSIERLSEELRSATVLADNEMPADVVRFNSIVTILDFKRKPHAFQIVSPEKGNIAKQKLSIIAPMGLALFGYSQDDVVKWQFPGGVQDITIMKVEQDEPHLKALSHD